MHHARRHGSLRRLFLGLSLLSCAPVAAQVHYHPDGRPWSQRARSGPDAEVPGWYYNLGITGLRVELTEEAPRHLTVRHVLSGSPAEKKILPGDVLVGVGGVPFATPHRNGYGMEVFGPEGPILDFAEALEACQSKEHQGRLRLSILRGERAEEVSLSLGTRNGVFAPGFPIDCKKSDRVLDACLDYLLEHQRDNGSWGSPPHDTFAPLALMARGTRKDMAAVEKAVRRHAETTRTEDDSSLINWRYMAAAIVMSEYYFATEEDWVIEELQEVYAFLIGSQYMDLSQVSERVRETHPRSYPKGPMEAHGGWGHNKGFEGYGPICMITGQGALAFSLMARCGIEIDRKRHDAAYAFLERGTGRNGYVWYEDSVAGHENWADMGRTGAAGIANALAPYPEPIYRERALRHARIIGLQPMSFPDTHGSPIVGMGFAAMAARVADGSFQGLMEANRWWFTLSQCPDGSFYYQPNRDNAGYGADSRISATAVTAFILSIPKGNLALTGKFAPR